MGLAGARARCACRPARHLVTIPFLCMCVCATLTCSSVVCRPGRPMCSRGWLIRVRVYIFLLQLPSPYKFNVPLLQPVDAERFINTQYMSGHRTRHAAQAATRLATPTRAEGKLHRTMSYHLDRAAPRRYARGFGTRSVIIGLPYMHAEELRVTARAHARRAHPEPTVRHTPHPSPAVPQVAHARLSRDLCRPQRHERT